MVSVGDQWNDSVLGDYLWSSGNAGEAVPDVMTPSTWSACQRHVTQSAGPRVVAGHPLWGTIGGRFYLNVSAALSIAKRLGSGSWVRELTDQSMDRLPDEGEIPLYRLGLWPSLRDLGAREVAVGVGSVARRPALARRLEHMSARCDEAHQRISAVRSAAELAELWPATVDVLFTDACWLMRYARPEAVRQALCHRALRRLVGLGHANAITTGSRPGDHLVSLDLLVALGDLDAGVIDRATFAARFGHRGPHEYELSIPRPGEDPSWIDRPSRRPNRHRHPPRPVTGPATQPALRDSRLDRDVDRDAGLGARSPVVLDYCPPGEQPVGNVGLPQHAELQLGFIGKAEM